MKFLTFIGADRDNTDDYFHLISEFIIFKVFML
jgi:hypothetical protein